MATTAKKVRRQTGLHHPTSVYAKQVVRGRLRDQCCPYEIAACQRHLEDLKRQGTKEFPYVFDTTRADLLAVIGTPRRCEEGHALDEPWTPSRPSEPLEDVKRGTSPAG